MAGRAELEEQDKGVVEGVWLFNDQAHFDSASQRILGQRFAEKMFEMVR